MMQFAVQQILNMINEVGGMQPKGIIYFL